MQIQELDRWAIDELGIPSIALMENAGRAVAEVVLKKLKSKPKASVVIVCGTGNNGGDGFVVARHLLNKGLNVKIFLLGEDMWLKADAFINYRALINMGINVGSLLEMTPAFKRTLGSADVIVDAMFGVGLNRPVQEPYYGVIKAINAQKAYVVAVDVPSGLDGTTGGIYSICVKASVTVTFSYPKKGFFKNQGPRHTGKLEIADIGIPRKF